MLLAPLCFAACVAGGPEEGGLATAEAGLVAEPTEAQQQIEANAETCGAICTVRGWIAEERYAEAREILHGRLDETPTDLETALMLAHVELRDEEFDSAYAVSDDTLRYVPESVQLMEKRALASLLGHDVETAVVDYEALIEQLQSLDFAPEHRICDAATGHCSSPRAREAQAWIGLATALYNRGEVRRAEAIATDILEAEALRGAVDPAYPWFVLALCASRRGDDTAALQYYEKVQARYPNEPASLINIGGIHYRAGDLDKSLDYQLAAFENAQHARRTAAIAWSNVAEIDILRGDYEAAEEKLLETLQISKRFAAGHFNLAVLYDLTGRADLARRHLKLGLVHDRQGVTRWNTSYFTPEWEAHFQALVHEAEGRTRAAATLWNHLLGSRVPALRASAERHLGTTEVAHRTGG